MKKPPKRPAAFINTIHGEESRRTKPTVLFYCTNYNPEKFLSQHKIERRLFVNLIKPVVFDTIRIIEEPEGCRFPLEFFLRGGDCMTEYEVISLVLQTVSTVAALYVAFFK